MSTPFKDVAAEHAAFNTKARQRIQQTEFMTSAPTFRLCPADIGFEVAFAGRSNAGKSSAINALTNQRQLARSSKTPGRTQMINFFSIGDTDRRLVDLPGYGYAAVPLEMKKEWQVELEEYLVSRSSLAGLVLMTDIRHPLKFFDEQMLHWAKAGNLPVHILLTKADKLKYGASKNALLNTRQALKKLGLDCSIQLFSALRKEGLDELAGVMGNWYRYKLDDDKNGEPVLDEQYDIKKHHVVDIESHSQSESNDSLHTEQSRLSQKNAEPVANEQVAEQQDAK